MTPKREFEVRSLIEHDVRTLLTDYDPDVNFEIILEIFMTKVMGWYLQGSIDAIEEAIENNEKELAKSDTKIRELINSNKA